MPAIPSSELVVNPDGSIYHLNLRPEQLADTVITVGDPGRVAQVSSHFEEVEHRVAKREFITHTGRLRGRRITVISTGIGPDNIDIVINELDALANIDLNTRQIKSELRSLDIIRVGTSGSLQKDIPVDSLVASAFGLGLDNLARFYAFRPNMAEAELEEALQVYQEAEGRWPVQPYAVQGSKALLQQIGSHMHQGITLTCPGFYAPQGRCLRLKASMPNPSRFADFQHGQWRLTNLEMETSAIYGMARMLGHRALSCNVILANRADGTFSKNPKASVESLIEEVLGRLCPD